MGLKTDDRPSKHQYIYANVNKRLNTGLYFPFAQGNSRINSANGAASFSAFSAVVTHLKGVINVSYGKGSN